MLNAGMNTGIIRLFAQQREHIASLNHRIAMRNDFLIMTLNRHDQSAGEHIQIGRSFTTDHGAVTDRNVNQNFPGGRRRFFLVQQPVKEQIVDGLTTQKINGDDRGQGDQL